MPKKKSKKVKKNGKGVGGKADVHAHEEGKRNKSLLPATIFFILLTSKFSPISATFNFLFSQS